MIKSLTAAMLLSASLAGAQTLNGPVPEQFKTGPTANTKLQSALESAKTAMNDGNEIGGIIVEKLKAAKILVVFAKQKEAAKTVPGESGGTVISLSDALPAYPRPLALAVAREVAAMIVADITPSSEREYMKASLAARAWIELGGEGAKLPVVETITGDKNAELSAAIKLWVDNKSELALYKIGEAAKTKSILDLREAAKSAADKKKLDDENARFVKFVLAENDWRQMHPTN